MDFLFVLFFLFIAFNMFRNFVKAAGKGAVKAASKGLAKTGATDPLAGIKAHIERAASQEKAPWSGGGYEGNYDDGEDWSFAKPKGQNKPRPVRRKKAKKARNAGLNFTGRKGSNVDKNRHRRDDWGRRSQEEVLSGKNIFFVLALALGGLYGLSLF